MHRMYEILPHQGTPTKYTRLIKTCQQVRVEPASDLFYHKSLVKEKGIRNVQSGFGILSTTDARTGYCFGARGKISLVEYADDLNLVRK